MKIVWSNRAIRSFQETVRFILETNSLIIANKFKNQLQNLIKIIKQNPNIASSELSLEHETIIYKSFVIDKYNKLIYYVKGEEIILADIWDTRMNPETLIRRVNE